MCSSARSPGPRHVAAAMLTPASLIAAATFARAPGVFSMSITRSVAIAGASLQRVGGAVSAPAEVLDDPVRVADRVAADDGDRDALLAGERADLRALAPAPRDADLVDRLVPAPQLARDPAARAEAVGRRAAAVERGHQPGAIILMVLPAVRSEKPATRSGSGWGVPGERIRPASRRRYQSIVSTSGSSWWPGFQPSSRRALVDRNAHHSEIARTSSTVTAGRPGSAAAAWATANAAGSGSLTAGGSTPDSRPRSAKSRSLVKLRPPRM